MFHAHGEERDIGLSLPPMQGFVEWLYLLILMKVSKSIIPPEPNARSKESRNRTRTAMGKYVHTISGGSDF